MKNDTFTVIPQNMVPYEMSIRKADPENDVFRLSYEKEVASDKLSTNEELIAYEYFKAGWEAAVNALKDEK